MFPGLEILQVNFKMNQESHGRKGMLKKKKGLKTKTDNVRTSI